MMNISIRRLGEHRGAPRLYIDNRALQAFGFAPGLAFRVDVDVQTLCLRIELCEGGSRKVSRKARAGGDVPVIDINSTQELGAFEGHTLVRVVLREGALHVLALASCRKASERAQRITTKLIEGSALDVASIAFGAGVTASALHAGFQDAGVTTELALANEISPVYVDVALANNPLITKRTVVINAPMQEAVNDDWLLRHLPKVDVLELGIPCSGASRAGVAKRGLSFMEQHPDVGHLVGALIQWVAVLQPAVVLAENVVGYRESGSAAILRSWLRDAGYVVTEDVLDARSFGSLEARVRWFLIAHPPGVCLDLAALPVVDHDRRRVLADVLEPIPVDSETYRPVQYLKDKARRDAADGKGFAMQLLDADATEVPTLRKGYHKGGSTDPRVRHPTNAELSRLLTAKEHARLKNIDESLIRDVSETVAHQVCGQSVDTRPVRAIGKLLASALLNAARSGGLGVLSPNVSYSSLCTG